MFSVGEDVEADALFKRGWTVSAIARHLSRDRKTVRAYLSGERSPGARRSGRADQRGPTCPVPVCPPNHDRTTISRPNRCASTEKSQGSRGFRPFPPGRVCFGGCDPHMARSRAGLQPGPNINRPTSRVWGGSVRG